MLALPIFNLGFEEVPKKHIFIAVHGHLFQQILESQLSFPPHSSTLSVEPVVIKFVRFEVFEQGGQSWALRRVLELQEGPVTEQLLHNRQGFPVLAYHPFTFLKVLLQKDLQVFPPAAQLVVLPDFRSQRQILSDQEGTLSFRLVDCLELAVGRRVESHK